MSAPKLVLWYEVVPRGVATLIAIPLVLVVKEVFWYGLLLCFAVLVGAVLFHLSEFRRAVPPWPGLRTLRADVADMKSAWGIESVGSLYQNAPVPLAGSLASTTAAGAFASSDRVYRYGTLAVVAAGNALQGWVLETTGAARTARNRVAFLIMGVIAAIGWFVLAVLGPWFSGWIFGQDKQGDPAVFHFLAIAFVAVSLSTPMIRNILIPSRLDSRLLIVTLFSATAGVGAMVVLGSMVGAVGVAIGFALSETLTLMSCVVLLIRLRRKNASAAPHARNLSS